MKTITRRALLALLPAAAVAGDPEPPKAPAKDQDTFTIESVRIVSMSYLLHPPRVELVVSYGEGQDAVTETRVLTTESMEVGY